MYSPAFVADGILSEYDPLPTLYFIVPVVVDPAFIKFWALPVYVNVFAVGAVTLPFAFAIVTVIYFSVESLWFLSPTTL